MTNSSMRYLIGLLALLSLLAGCRRKDSVDDVRIQPGVQPGYLPLKIAKTYERQQLLEQSPWHADGGNWTFLDCQLDGDPSTRFVIGVLAKGEPKGDIPMAWGEAMLAVPDAQAGVRFVDAFAKAFHQTAPTSHGKSPLRHLKVHTAILGSNLPRDPEGGFGRGKGTWTASKWFLSDDIGETEVFFNYSVAKGRAEFSEKDEEYREGLVQQLVIGLRDGPLPERTPENDPNLTLRGPVVTDWKLIASSNATCWFTPDGRNVVVAETLPTGGTRFFAVLVAQSAEQRPIAELEGVASVHEFLTNRQELTALIVETLRQKGRSISSNDPQRLWLATGGQKRAVPIPAALTNWYLNERCLSPEGQFIALHAWKSVSQNKRIRVIHVGDLAGQKWQVIEIPDTLLELKGWKNGGAVVLTGSGFKKDEVRKAFQLDPANGKLTPLDQIPREFETGAALSPDGAHVLRVEEKRRLFIAGTADGKVREFVFHPYDRQNVFDDSVVWASPRYLAFQGLRTALIDAQSLKMSFPTTKESGFTTVEFSPDFKVALGRKTEGYYLGRVALD